MAKETGLPRETLFGTVRAHPGGLRQVEGPTLGAPMEKYAVIRESYERGTTDTMLARRLYYSCGVDSRPTCSLRIQIMREIFPRRATLFILRADIH